MNGSSAVQGGAILVQADTRDRPLYEALAASGYRLLGFPAGYAGMVAAQGIPIQPVDFGDAAEPAARQRGQAAAPAIVARVEDALRLPDFGPFIGIEDEQVLAAVRQTLAGRLPALMTAAAVAVEAFERLVARERVRLVLLRHEGAHPAKAVLLAARRHGIPTVHLEHGIPFSRTSAAHIHSDVVAVYGEWTRAWYARFQNPLDRVAITGNPAWDGYREAAALHDPRQIKVSLGLDPDQPLVMFAGTVPGARHAVDFLYPDWAWQHCLVALQALATVHQRWRLQIAVKVHPMETDPRAIDRYARAVQETGVPGVILTGHADARHLLASDLVMCVDSNIAIEAMLLDRPAMTLRLGRIFADYLFDDDDGVLVVTEAAALPDSIKAALFDSGTQAGLAVRRARSLYRLNYLNDGRALERVRFVIESLLEPAGVERRLAQGAPAPLRDRMSAAGRASVGVQHLEQAQRELEAGRPAAAAYVAERALPFLDDPSGAHFLRGFAGFQRGDAAAALEAFRQAIAANPANPSFHNAAGAALLELGRTAEAEKAMRDALRQDPQHLDSLVNLGEILLRLGRRAEAAAFLERAATLAPDDAHVVALLAQARG